MKRDYVQTNSENGVNAILQDLKETLTRQLKFHSRSFKGIKNAGYRKIDLENVVHNSSF